MAYHLPLTEASAEEIIARTAYQIVLADYRTNPDCYDNATTRLLDLALQWRSDGLHVIADALADAALFCASGHTIASWRQLRTGLTLARVQSLARAGQARRR